MGDATAMRERKMRIPREVLGKSAQVRIGKEGVSENVVKEIQRSLEREGVVKVKVLKALARQVDVKVLASEVSRMLNAELIDVRGHVFIVRRRRGRKS
ncbi:MAG: YhbY family RNA-binding protein [Zestosphaera sp.]